MPWHISKNGEKWDVVKDDDNTVAGSHDSEDKAKKQLAALYANEPAMHSERVAFDDFAAIRPGPIRILPEGRWFRGGRVLDVTRQRLEDMVRNFQSGLPRFRVGINLDHKEDQGKVGNIKNVAYIADGERGPGLYATEYDLTPKGAKAVGDDGYDGVSAEVVWSLNGGAKYQDPETGNEHDNVLVGLALTPTPFFGHQHVALFSAKEQDMDKTVLETLRDSLRQLLGMKEVSSAEPVVIPEPIPAEKAEVSMEKEEFDVKLREQAELLAAEMARADKLEAAIASEKLAARKVVLKTEAEAFKALSIEPDKYADAMAELEAIKPELATWVKGLLAGADAAAKTIVAEKGSDHSTEGMTLHQYAAALVEKDKMTYSDALALASKQHPELAK
jgi:hypothetical protein